MPGDVVKLAGEASPGAFAKAIENLTPPRGGTEIGGALDQV